MHNAKFKLGMLNKSYTYIDTEGQKITKQESR